MKDPKTIAIIILVILAAVFGYMAFKPAPIYDDALAKHELARLNRENDSLLTDIAKHTTQISVFNAKIDSLENLKPKIQTIYVTKIKEIDSASAGHLINSFTTIFADNNVEQQRH